MKTKTKTIAKQKAQRKERLSGRKQRKPSRLWFPSSADTDVAMLGVATTLIGAGLLIVGEFLSRVAKEPEKKPAMFPKDDDAVRRRLPHGSGSIRTLPSGRVEARMPKKYDPERRPLGVYDNEDDAIGALRAAVDMLEKGRAVPAGEVSLWCPKCGGDGCATCGGSGKVKGDSKT